MSAVDEYLAGLDEEQRIQLERIRRIVKETVPDVEEASSYGMPAFKYRGRPVLGFTARKSHLSIHPFSPDAVEAVRKRLSGYEISKGTIRFTEDLPIPADIVKQVPTLGFGRSVVQEDLRHRARCRQVAVAPQDRR